MQEVQLETSINYVVGVSWPRSGHHLLTRILQKYIGERFVYCPHYSKERGMGHYNMANCCDNELCASQGEVHYCKNHDFKFNIPKVAGARYLVQYRAFLPAVVSDFELYVRAGGADTPEHFKCFSMTKAYNYKRFVRKWVEPEDEGIQKLMVPYENLTKNTEEMLVQALTFFGLGEDIDRQRLRDIIANIAKKTVMDKEIVTSHQFGVRDTRKIEDFRFYTPGWFQELERIVNSDLPPEELLIEEFKLVDFNGRMLAPKRVAPMSVGEKTGIEVEIINATDRAWRNNPVLPIKLSYHWVTAFGKPVIFDGLRTDLPKEGIFPGQTSPARMSVEAPPQAGTYTLVLTLVQESVSWFENEGFKPAVLKVKVRNDQRPPRDRNE